MFTGIIAAVGTIVERTPLAGGQRITIDTAGLGLDDVALGDSIAVDGCCLTVVERAGARAAFDVSLESIARTAGFDLGRKVNLEKALRLSDRLGGHLVSGHVDGVGTLREFSEVGESWKLVVEAPAGLGRYIAEKGSITVNGISLTVNAVSDGPGVPDERVTAFAVNIIPHTLQMTNLGEHRPGARVNLEIDMLARYVERLRA
ncbi:MAG: riboflavin synthase [Rhodocyclaceae bacterium]|jgi:riboflavin synthase|nr:riboflavin synthase [Rhodocyclaceae bacterium]MCE2979220.1 riboflavin synthase [Betaproteobacteria bacterium]MCA3073377.1 riboflavin synthase [Rhodocyclaceae bacterium]MCA3088593.1 riboflavin synthase [Rhodocyclaceae bacterium]MCA3092623.1 riboflavin synthase [Rhodocyclaceae bacterium]